METYINPTPKPNASGSQQKKVARKIIAAKRTLIRKKFVNKRSLALIFLATFAFIYGHVLLIRHLPLYAIVLVEATIFFLLWNKIYQMVYDLKLLFLFNKSYDAGETFPEGEEYPTITFLLPSYHEPFNVAKMTFDSIVRSAYEGRKDIIVVDNSTKVEEEDFIAWKSYVESYAILHPDANLTARFIHNTEQGKLKPGNLDIGCLHVEDSEYVVILDIDSTLPARGNLLETAIAEFMADPKLGFLQFTIRATNNHFNDLTQSVAASQDLHRLRLVSRSYGGYKIFEGHNGMWRTSVMDKIGPWTDYYKGRIMITEDILKSAIVYANGYYGKSLNIPTGEWVPASLNALQGMWMRWTYGTSQVLFKYYKEIYSRHLSVAEKMDVTYHILNHLVNGFMFPFAILMQWFVPGNATNLFLFIGFIVPQLIGVFSIYFTSVSKLKVPVWKRIQYVYAGFFLVDPFTMITQLKSTLHFLVGLPQGWKVTAKGVESTSKWKELLISKSFHLGIAIAGIAVCLGAWIIHDNADPARFAQYGILLFISLHVLLCVAVFGKERQQQENDVETATVDGMEENTVKLPEYKFDVA